MNHSPLAVCSIYVNELLRSVLEPEIQASQRVFGRVVVPVPRRSIVLRLSGVGILGQNELGIVEHVLS